MKRMIPIKELRAFFYLSLPFTAANLIQATSEYANASIVGKTEANLLAATGLISLLATPVSLICNAPLSALQPIISELHGENNKEAIQTVLQQGWLVGLVLSVPQVIILASSKSILELLNQPKNLINAAENYFYLAIAALPATALLTANLAFANSTKRVSVPIAVNALNLALSTSLNALLLLSPIRMSTNDLTGYGVSMLIQTWTTSLGMKLYLKHLEKKEQFQFYQLSRKDYRGLFNRFLKLGGVMAAKLLFISIASIYKQTLIGHFGVQAILANQVASSYTNFCLYINDATSLTVLIKSANAIGEKNAEVFNRTYKIGLVVSFSCALLFALPTFFVPQVIENIFVKNNDKHDSKLIHNILFFNGAQLLFDSISQVLTGAFLSSEDSTAPAMVSLVTFVLIILPISLGLYFLSKLESQSIAIGYLMGSIVQSLAMLSAWNFKKKIIQQKLFPITEAIPLVLPAEEVIQADENRKKPYFFSRLSKAFCQFCPPKSDYSSLKDASLEPAEDILETSHKK